MKNLVRTLLIPVVVLGALSTAARAQTVFNAIGSSGLYLELGEAAYSNSGSSCAWSGGKNLAIATDTESGSPLTDTGNTWVVWVPSVGNTCTTNAAPATVYGYLQTDSVVGNRCLFNAQNGGLCTISYANASGTSPAGSIEGSNEVSLPSAVASTLTGATVNAAGTDIRPEDAEFAVTRALTPCGSSTTLSSGSIAPYLGLGYTDGGSIGSHFSSSTFNVINFSLPATYFVQPVGFDPILVVVNTTDPSGTGFNSANFKNISSANLASYLDGSLGSTSAVVGDTPATTTTIVREPLSGTYNTMEYNVPNSSALKTSQDVGVNQLSSQVNCSGTVPASNPMAIENTLKGSWRYRAIGTGEELKEVFNTNESLGYAFWGVSNFAAAPLTSKYVMVDGWDPLQNSYTGGVIPTTTAEFGNITFAHMSDGTYPIWSLLRIVTADSGSASIAQTLALAAGSFSTSSHPDFLPYYTTKGAPAVNLERSHFAPPGITFSGTNKPSNHGNLNGYGKCTTAESGGDVGGVVLFVTSDAVYCNNTGSTFGMVNRRK